MSALSTGKLIERLRDVGSRRLVVAPLLEPDEQMKPGRASIDVRLGSRFRLAETTVEGVVDTLNRPERSTPKQAIYIPLGKELVLHPHQLLLGETLEFVRLPSDLLAYVVGRSSWGRDGLVVATAVGVHPGFSGPITLELRNLGEIPLCLYPADPIAQLFIHEVSRVDGEPDVPVASQFSGSSGPRPGQHRYATTGEKLRKIREKKAQRLPRDAVQERPAARRRDPHA